MSIEVTDRPTADGGAPEVGRGSRLVLDSPVGPLALCGDAGAVTNLFLPNTAAARGASSPGPLPAPLRQAAIELDEYFAGRRTWFDLPFDLRGTRFQVQVWRALADIPYGGTVTYAELARRVGRPAAFRAVGQANGANPLPIFFPCHRVVASGGLGGYGGGLDVKRHLLELEGWTAPGP